MHNEKAVYPLCSCTADKRLFVERMAKTLYCWRCKMEIPMLDDREWERVGATFTNSVQAIKTYRETHNVPLSEAKTQTFWEALALYREITGFPKPIQMRCGTIASSCMVRHAMHAASHSCAGCKTLLRMRCRSF